jgi:hypothetical protein
MLEPICGTFGTLSLLAGLLGTFHGLQAGERRPMTRQEARIVPTETG